MSKDRSGGKYFLERVENILIGGVELPRNVLPGEACQWNNNVQVVEDKLAVMSRSLTVDFIFIFSFYFILFYFSFYF